jgi:hypothetical protein
MDKATFEIADPIVDKIADAVTELLESQTQELRTRLTQRGNAIGSRYAVSLDVSVGVFDREQERSLPLLQTGLAGFEKEKPYQTWGDSTPQRYVVGGQMLIVPHDRCPKCWEVWDFKFKHPTCGHCGATMGEEVKLLLDNDVCPFCEKGKVSMSMPICDQCGYHVDPDTVTWG